ncbi:hypothetical protein [Maricaulis sp. CAU 1757]
MAKAIFHKHQRVYVRPVGTWALIEQVKPHWVKDVEEPVRIYYDCGLGRDFVADELSAEQASAVEGGEWRVLRARNKWQSADECAHHPHPGTFPVVVTESMDWGGWRVPAAEYDRDPQRIETQARLIANSVRLLGFAERLRDFAEQEGDLPEALNQLVRQAKDVLREVELQPGPAGAGKARDAA